MDTDILISLLKGDPDALEAMRGSERRGEVCISAVSVFELAYSTKGLSEKREKALKGLIGALRVLPLDAETAMLAADIGSSLSKKGMMVHPMDLLIGATALGKGMPLVTRNRKHFERLKGLELIEW